MPTLRPAHRVPETELSLEAGLVIDGHAITRRGLLLPLGIDVVAGISTELLVRGPRATIVLEETLQQPVADAVLSTISAAFTTLRPRHLPSCSTPAGDTAATIDGN